MSEIVLDPGRTSLSTLRRILSGGGGVILSRDAKPAVDRSAETIRSAVGDTPVYGVNTGFGKLASVRIAKDQLSRLQRNLVCSHSAGVGEPTPAPIVRLMMALKLLSLGRGASGVRWELVELMEGMLARDVLPVVPVQGSVGASGDLAPLAHMSAAMIGEGEVTFGGTRMNAAEGLARAELEPVELAAKEGLALINGTQFSTAYALVGLYAARVNVEASIVAAALSTDAIMGSTAPLRPEIHELRGHRGQIEIAAATRALMEGSEIRESHRTDDVRVQDPYCIRCHPQVLGACVDVLRHAAETLKIEANAATDNPLVVGSETADIVSGGNFHAEPVALAADQIALAIAETGSIAQRRVSLMADPTLNCDLPAFLAPDPGLNSGFMVAEITSAALMSENKHLANPCATDSTPTSANQEDHVSMAAHGARRLERMNDNLSAIIGIEALCAAQGIEYRAPMQPSAPLRAALARLRQDCPTLKDDRILSGDLAAATDLVRGGELVAAAQDGGLLGWDD